MKPAVKSLSITASMITTHSEVKLRLFCVTSLLVGSTCSLWLIICRSIPGMSHSDHANTSLLFWRKVVSSTFSAKLRHKPISAFLYGLSGLRGTSLTSLSSFHPFLGERDLRTDSFTMVLTIWLLLRGSYSLSFLNCSTVRNEIYFFPYLFYPAYRYELCLLALLQPLGWASSCHRLMVLFPFFKV